MKSISRVLSRLYKTYILRDQFYLSVKQWFKDDGDNTLRLKYDLNENSLVFDIGGYEGEFADKIYRLYGCSIYIFEPVSSFYSNIKSRFSGNKAIKTFKFGLSDKDRQMDINLDSDGSSVHTQGKNTEQIILKPINEFIREKNIQQIDLMKINIEGGEFELLPALINSGLINRVKNIQVQFHNFIPDAIKSRESIRHQLANTHKLTYDYYFVWENWTIR